MNAQVMNRDCLVTAAMIAHLPEPVQRYMTFTGVVGKPWIETVSLKYAGQFRLGAGKPWMGIRVHQVYTTNPPGFQWKARFKLYGLPLVSGLDTYKNGQGHMFGKLAGLYTLFDARDEETLQGTMLRYLNEMTWFPTAYLGENITWQAVNDNSADATFSHAGKSVSARFYFDDEGRLLTFIAQRYGTLDGKSALRPWATPMTAYGPFAGLNLPGEGLAVWQLPGGDLPYITVRLTDLVYNQPIAAF